MWLYSEDNMLHHFVIIKLSSRSLNPTKVPIVSFFCLAFDFCQFCVVINFFIPATTANDLWLRRISIPDLIHYIFCPIFILEKEPIFPCSMLSAKQGNYCIVSLKKENLPLLVSTGWFQVQIWVQSPILTIWVLWLTSVVICPWLTCLFLVSISCKHFWIFLCRAIFSTLFSALMGKPVKEDMLPNNCKLTFIWEIFIFYSIHF